MKKKLPFFLSLLLSFTIIPRPGFSYEFSGKWVYKYDRSDDLKYKKIELEIRGKDSCSALSEIVTAGKSRSETNLGCYLNNDYIEIYGPHSGNYIIRGVLTFKDHLLKIIYKNDADHIPPWDRYREYILKPLSS